jgi:hypothetical protein
MDQFDWITTTPSLKATEPRDDKYKISMQQRLLEQGIYRLNP